MLRLFILAAIINCSLATYLNVQYYNESDLEKKRDIECTVGHLFNYSHPDEIPKEAGMIESRMDEKHSCGWSFSIKNTSSCEFDSQASIVAGFFYNPQNEVGCNFASSTSAICFCKGSLCNTNAHLLIEKLGGLILNKSYADETHGNLLMCTVAIISDLYQYGYEKLPNMTVLREQPELLPNWIMENKNRNDEYSTEIHEDKAPLYEPFILTHSPWRHLVPIAIYLVLAFILLMFKYCGVFVCGLKKSNEKLD